MVAGIVVMVAAMAAEHETETQTGKHLSSSPGARFKEFHLRGAFCGFYSAMDLRKGSRLTSSPARAFSSGLALRDPTGNHPAL